MTTRLPDNDRNAQEVVKHLTATFEHVGRMLHAMQRGNWDSARDHMSLTGQQAAITNVCLNVGSPDTRRVLADAREQLPKEWADAIAAFLAGTPAPRPAGAESADVPAEVSDAC